MTIPALPVPMDLAARLVGTPLLLLLDIDGTLTPIAATPAAAVVSEHARDSLGELTHTNGVHVAIVTGRSVEDARRLVGVSGAWYAGNHGIEVAAPGQEPIVPDEVAQFQHPVEVAAARLAQVVRGFPGTILENKRWTLSVHYRLAERDAVPELGHRVRKVARELELDVTGGKEVFELRPPVRINKGTAAIELARRLGALDHGASILCAGDDETDEDMLRAVRGRARTSVTVAVEPVLHARPTSAEFFVGSPREMLQLLDAVLLLRTETARRG
jgi:trehalose 6-phosphate phosphatase